jgi:hypothetical protein
MKKFYPQEVVEKGYSTTMLRFLASLFPHKKFSLHEYDLCDTMFMKGFDDGYYLAEKIAAEENQ